VAATTLAVMNLVGSVQGAVLLVLGIGSLILTGFAAIDALRRRSALFPHVGRLTKPVWLGILGAAFLVAVVSLYNALFFLNVVGVIAAGIYLAEVRPKLRQIDGGGRSSGPYGGY
jgi:Protein of unknown function (DUF2516)